MAKKNKISWDEIVKAVPFKGKPSDGLTYAFSGSATDALVAGVRSTAGLVFSMTDFKQKVFLSKLRFGINFTNLAGDVYNNWAGAVSAVEDLSASPISDNDFTVTTPDTYDPSIRIYPCSIYAPEIDLNLVVKPNQQININFDAILENAQASNGTYQALFTCYYKLL